MYLQTVRPELFPQLLISNPPYLLHYKQKSQHLSLDQPPLLKTEQILKFLHRCVSTDLAKTFLLTTAYVLLLSLYLYSSPSGSVHCIVGLDGSTCIVSNT